ncbi:MAG: sugar ABC transporter substrate-binding protein [Actinomycetota bacterium]
MAIAALFVVAACGGDDSDTEASGDSSSTASEASTDSTEAVDEAEADGDDAVSISFASFGTDDEEIERQLIANFENDNPDVSVDSIEYLAPGDYWTRMEALAATGDLPCVMWMSSGFVEGWTNDGLLLDIQQYVDDDINADDYFTGTFDVARNKATGNMHAFPFRFVETVLYYNIDAFEEAGVDLPSNNWTWDEYLDAARALTVDENDDGLAEQYGMYFYGRYAHVESWIFNNGGSLLSADGSTVEPDAAAVEALQFLSDQINVEGVAPAPKEFDGVGNAEIFTQGFAAMWIDGSWNVGPFRDSADFDWGIAPVPQGPSASGPTAYGWPDLFAISSNCENPDEAWRLINYMTGPDRTNDLISPGGIPVYKPLAEDPVFLEPDQLPANKDFLIEWAGYTGPTSFTPSWGEWRGYVDGAGFEGQMDLVFNGEADLDDALDEAVEFANEVLNR